MRNLADAICRRLEKGISQRALAEELGVSHELLRLYIKGTRTASPETLRRIGPLLGVPSETIERWLGQTHAGKAAVLREKYIAEDTPDSDTQVNALLQIFFEHANREETDELRSFLTRQYTQILKGKKKHGHA